MKRYLEHIKSRDPHERRRHALSWAGIATGVFALLWLASFSARLGGGIVGPAEGPAGSDQAAAAQTALPSDQAQLQISTTSVYSQ